MLHGALHRAIRAPYRLTIRRAKLLVHETNIPQEFGKQRKPSSLEHLNTDLYGILRSHVSVLTLPDDFLHQGGSVNNALAVLKERLSALHLASGELSTREISKRSHGTVSHTTAHQVLRGSTLPSWRSLEPVVLALGGSANDFKPLWIKARSDEEASDNGGTVGGGVYRGSVDPKIAATVNLFNLYIKKKELQKAKNLLISEMEGEKHADINLVAELYSRLYYRDAKIKQRYGKVIQSFIEHGDIVEVNSASAAHYLARECLEQSNLLRALTFAQRAHSLNPHSAGYASVHGEALYALGQYAEAEQILIAAHQMDPKPTLFRFSQLAELLIFRQNYRKLEELMRESYENAGGSAGSEADDLAEILRMCGKPAEAVSVAKEALKKEIKYVVTKVSLRVAASRALCQQKLYEEARLMLREDADLYEDERDLKLEYANAYAQQGLHGESAKILEELIPDT
ncbi:tetratricopeptide repeat protein [Streptomyces phyllanthi]|uniref:tetratricopeptide repeat protein n=1 Tax=Streptomyces phyllanthi TaxID=1803180 RepID=UPI001D13BD62|nr:hypothetical protein [Streptomyces phyllanthi]